jgi:hypothetical protein
MWECTCYAVSAILVLLIAYIIMTEFGLPHRAASTSPSTGGSCARSPKATLPRVSAQRAVARQPAPAPAPVPAPARATRQAMPAPASARLASSLPAQTPLPRLAMPAASARLAAPLPAQAPLPRGVPGAVPTAPVAPAMQARNVAYDPTGLFMLQGEAEPQADADATALRDSDTAHYFVDSGADKEAYRPTNLKQALSSAGNRPDLVAKSDTGSALRPPARTRGNTTNSWLALLSNNSSYRQHGTQEISFNSSSALDAVRASAAAAR